MKKLTKSGFSMIELLVVLLIIGILAAVAAPLFFQNTDKAKLSEAVAGLGSIRSAERQYRSQNTGYFAITDGKTYFGAAAGNQSALLGTQIHGAKYFSPKSYTVDVGGVFTSVPTGVAAAQDYVIKVNGSAATNLALSVDAVDGAADIATVATFQAEMDNSGQTIYTTDGTTWNKY